MQKFIIKILIFCLIYDGIVNINANEIENDIESEIDFLLNESDQAIEVLDNDKTLDLNKDSDNKIKPEIIDTEHDFSNNNNPNSSDNKSSHSGGNNTRNIDDSKNINGAINEQDSISNNEDIFNIEKNKCIVSIALVDKISTERVLLSLTLDQVSKHKAMQIKLHKCYRNINNSFAYIEINENINYNDDTKIRQTDGLNSSLNGVSIDNNYENNKLDNYEQNKNKLKVIFKGWIALQDLMYNNINHDKYEVFIDNIATPIN